MLWGLCIIWMGASGVEWSEVVSSEHLQRGMEEGVNEEKRKEKKTYLGCSG